MVGCPEPVEYVITVDNLEALTVLTSHPTRMGIVDTLRDSDAPLTIRQIAERLDEPFTRLYHHVGELVEHNLVMKCDSIRQNGRTAVTYMVRAKHFTLAPDVLQSDGGQHFLRTGQFILELVNSEFVRAVQSGALEDDEEGRAPYHISRHIFQLDGPKLERLKQMLDELHIFAKEDDDVSASSVRYVLTHFLLRYVPPKNDR